MVTNWKEKKTKRLIQHVYTISKVKIAKQHIYPLQKTHEKELVTRTSTQKHNQKHKNNGFQKALKAVLRSSLELVVY
jgi:hypothetical protein